MWREGLWQFHPTMWVIMERAAVEVAAVISYIGVPCIFTCILIWPASQVDWPSIMHYSFLSHLGRNWVSRVVNWSRVEFELRTLVFWSTAVSIGVIAFKLWCMEMVQKLSWWVEMGGWGSRTYILPQMEQIPLYLHDLQDSPRDFVL